MTPTLSLDAPAALWLLAALPVILILWMLRPRRPRVRIPSILLWPSSQAERQAARPWQRLRNHPLLWLQLLIAALLALAAAQPFVPSEVVQRQVIVLLDASGSMAARDIQPTRWDAARASVVDLAKSLRPDQTLSILRLDEEPRLLLAGTRDAQQVEVALRDEQPSRGGIDQAAAVALASGLVRGEQSEWVMVGDGTVPPLPEGMAPPSGTRVRFVPIGSPTASNVALAGLTIRPVAAALALQLAIQNAGDQPASGTVQLLAEGERVVASSSFEAQPRDQAYLTWSGIDTGPRWFEARLTSVEPASANHLFSDDHAWATPAQGGSASRVLLVSGGNTFLERVLAIQSGLRVEKISPADSAVLLAQPEAAYALAVFDRQSPGTVASGQGSALYIGGVGGEAFRPGLIAPRPDHPLLRSVDWSEVRVRRAFTMSESSSGWETVVDSDGGPLLSIRTLRQETAPDQPARLRREALLSFDLGDSDLPLRPAFPVLMANLVDWLVPSNQPLEPAIPAGAAATLHAAPLAQALRVEWVVDPDVSEDLAPPWPPRPFHPRTPGVYRVLQEGLQPQPERFVVAEAYAPSEADITPRTPALSGQSGAEALDAAAVLRSVRGGLWPWLLAALLLLSLLEWGVDARGR